MTPVEAVMLCRIVVSYCPQQTWDEYTADAYHDLMGDYPFPDCRDAVRKLGQSQTWISPADIYGEVKRVRTKRVADAADKLLPPPGLTDAEERDWLRYARKAIADGEPIPDETRELKPRHLPDLKVLLPAPDDRPRADPPHEPKRIQEPDMTSHRPPVAHRDRASKEAKP